MVSVRIPLSSRKYPGLFALVDEGDYWLVSPYLWTPRKDDDRFYAVTNATESRLTMHRYIMGAPRGVQVDHVNGNGLDNRRGENLRFAEQWQNMANRTKNRNGSSAYKGVSLRKESGKWRAQIQCRGKKLMIGDFLTEEAAADAYQQKAKELFGDYASTRSAPAPLASVAAIDVPLQSRRRPKSGYHGVLKWGRRFISQIGTWPHREKLGPFDTAEEAARAFDSALLRVGGNPLFLNFPQEE